MSALLSTVLTAAVGGNLALDGLLGLCPLLAVSRKHEVAAGMALMTIVALPSYCVLAYMLKAWVLQPLNAESLALVVWVLLLATFVVAAGRWLSRSRPTLHESYGVYLPLLGVNCLVLGAVLLATTRADSLFMVLAYALGTALGYAAVLLVITDLRERLAMTPLPMPMRGAAAVLVTLGLLSLALMGLRGVG